MTNVERILIEERFKGEGTGTWERKEKEKLSMYENAVRGLGMVVHTFSPKTWETEAGRSLCLPPAWSNSEFLTSQGLSM